MSEIIFKTIVGLSYAAAIVLMWYSFMEKRKRAKIISELKKIYDVAQSNPNFVAEYSPEMEVLRYLIGYYSKSETISPESAYALCLLQRTPYNMRKAQCLYRWIHTGRFSFYTN